jgi:CubicO group peptidase (beta-lactamase class C family)
LDDAFGDPFCTVDTCLRYLALAGTRWAYHNGPYTLLDGVISGATGQTLNQFTNQRLKQPTGMDGLFIPSGFNNVYYSTARSMARFGWLIYNRGWWNGQAVLNDSVYFNQMVNTSQPHNLSYGYLWWLNGKASYKLPGSQINIPGFMNPDAPADMIAAMGKNGQFINVVPSQGMVWIRMGDAPDNSPVPFLLQNKIWQYINQLPCGQGAAVEMHKSQRFTIYPQPAAHFFYLKLPVGWNEAALQVAISDIQGRMLKQLDATAGVAISIENLSPGQYLVQLKQDGRAAFQRLIVH